MEAATAAEKMEQACTAAANGDFWEATFWARCARARAMMEQNWAAKEEAEAWATCFAAQWAEQQTAEWRDA